MLVAFVSVDAAKMILHYEQFGSMSPIPATGSPSTDNSRPR